MGINGFLTPPIFAHEIDSNEIITNVTDAAADIN